MKLIERAKSHFESLGVQSMEISEWKDEDNNPSVIYWNPITLSEKNKLFKKSDNLNDVGILADIIVMKAIDKDGNKLFTLEDKIALMHKTDSPQQTLTAGTSISFVLGAEGDGSGDEIFSGSGIITGMSVGVPLDGITTRSVTFQGTGTLTRGTA